MNNKSFTTTILVDQSPMEVFNAINNVRGWWSQDIEGNTEKLNDEFIYHYREVHRCKMKIVESVPGKKVVWHVVNNYFNFIKDKAEWKDTRVSFEINQKDNKTELTFTHIGLVPEYECFEICQDAWSHYIKSSLYNLITTGEGQPNPKEGKYEFNEQLIEKWNLEQ
jgi:predicted phosphohydrolase